MEWSRSRERRTGQPDPRVLLPVTQVSIVLVGLAVLSLLGISPARGLRTNLALDAGARGEKDRAAQELDRLAQETPDKAACWLRAGRALVEDGRAREGAERLARATALDPTSVTARYDEAKALMAAGLDDEAETVLKALFERMPDHADGLFLYSAIAAARGDASEATSRFRAALDVGYSTYEHWRAETRFDRIRDEPAFLEVADAARTRDAFRGAQP